jgi:hypothetical protein
LEAKECIVKKDAEEMPQGGTREHVRRIVLFRLHTRPGGTGSERKKTMCSAVRIPSLRGRDSRFLEASVAFTAASEEWSEGKLLLVDASGRIDACSA